VAWLLVAGLLAGCAVQPAVPPREAAGGGVSATVPPGATMSFASVVSRVEPVAEDLCRRRGNVRDCDFRIIYDDRPGVPANAYQTLDERGRPVLIVTGPLFRDTRNAHEIAFVLGHEAAHHIEGHLARQQASAVWGAVLIGSVIAASGGDPNSVEAGQRLGAQAGSRVFSKDFELEADALGTVIAARSGFDPVQGAEFFARIPDPGNVFLGTHPPNADRQRVVRETAARLSAR
jgi:Zn-dependent protease with chaperone function